MNTLYNEYKNNPDYGMNMRDYYKRFPNYYMNRPLGYHHMPQGISAQRMPNQGPPSQRVPGQMPPNQIMPRQGTPNQVRENMVFDIEEATTENNNYRQTAWTGQHMQLTFMSIDVGKDIGLEIHSNLDQFIRVEQGEGTVFMGDSMNNLDFQAHVNDDYAIIIPAGTWHNLVNTGDESLKLYSIYSPPAHHPGTIHISKDDAMADENH